MTGTGFMNDTTYQQSKQASVGYELEKGHMTPGALPNFSQLFGVGDMYMNPTDMYLFDRALFTHKLLKSDSGGGGIWTKPYGVPGAEYLGGTVGDMRSFYVDKIAKIQNNGITTEWIHLQNYGWVDRTNTRSQIIMSEINYTLFGRYGILPRNYDLYSEYGSQLRQAGLTGINQLNF